MKRLTYIILFLFFSWSFNTVCGQEEPTQQVEEDQIEGESIIVSPFDEQQTEPEKKNREMKTLFRPGRKQGFYGSMSTAYSPIDNKDGLTFSARGTWLIDRSFGLGFGGTGFRNNIEQIESWPIYTSSSAGKTLTGGYAGVIVEPILLPRLPVHLSFPILLGLGAASTYDPLLYHYYQIEDIFFIAEPHVELEFNLTCFARVAIYGSYRFASSLKIENVSSSALNGYSAGFILKLGLFR